MRYATNPIGRVRTSFEDSGGDGPPVLVYPGFSDPLAYAKASPLCEALADEFRLIYADHRGQGASDKPHDSASYALTTRAADAVEILDELDIARAHFIGFSWGARLGFALGEHAPDRLLSLVLCGNQPYEWPTDTLLWKVVAEAVEAGESQGIAAFLESWEGSLGARFPEEVRAGMLDNDPLALAAAFRSASAEGSISTDLSKWTIPCLIYAGADDEMHEGARRGANEIPNATFVSLAGQTHYSADQVTEGLLPRVLDLFRSVSLG